ncbi:MAG: 16S rRNA (cytidine(1402)-2'-O)-methyltransferase [Ardenticatenales bacterium]
MSTLYVVATPLGNLEDLTLRALRILSEVPLVLAEDTRHTRRLLARYDLHPRLLSCHAHTTPAQYAALVAALDDGDAALVSDAGTPGVSDPGIALVQAALQHGHTVVPVPGPSAPATALSVSGLPADAYLFLGFLPRRAAPRRAQLRQVAGLPYTLVVFEAPHRLAASLADLAAVLGDRTVAVNRELTKRFEEVWRGTLAGAASEWSARTPVGEFTLVIAGASADRAVQDEDAVRAALASVRAGGVGRREASRIVAEQAGWAARDVYRLWEDRP